MGQNKAFLKYKGLSFIERIIKKLASVTGSIIIVTNKPELYFELRAVAEVVPDIYPSRGPLGGIHAGLKISPTLLNFVVACDMPFIDHTLVRYMIKEAEEFDVVVPKIGTYLEPLHAVYSKNCLKPIENMLHENIYKLTAFYHLMKVKYIEENQLKQFVDLNRVFYNVNTPSDMKKIATMRYKEGGLER